jgi:hypothetical protein
MTTTKTATATFSVAPSIPAGLKAFSGKQQVFSLSLCHYPETF